MVYLVFSASSFRVKAVGTLTGVSSGAMSVCLGVWRFVVRFNRPVNNFCYFRRIRFVCVEEWLFVVFF